MLVEVQIVKTKKPKKTFVAFNNLVRPNKGDLTIGIRSVCTVKEIFKGVDIDQYFLSDGSTITNPIKVIGEIEEFDSDLENSDEGPFYISCQGSIKNPILAKDGNSITLINFY